MRPEQIIYIDFSLPESQVTTLFEVVLAQKCLEKYLDACTKYVSFTGFAH